MRLNALRARQRRRGLPKDAGDRAAIMPNVLDRQFTADRPNQKWVADFTYIWTAEGWLYVAAVIDLFSRRVVGWSMNANMTAQLVTDALIMAIWRRGEPDALLHHSDQSFWRMALFEAADRRPAQTAVALRPTPRRHENNHGSLCALAVARVRRRCAAQLPRVNPTAADRPRGNLSDTKHQFCDRGRSGELFVSAAAARRWNKSDQQDMIFQISFLRC